MEVEQWSESMLGCLVSFKKKEILILAHFRQFYDSNFVAVQVKSFSAPA